MTAATLTLTEFLLARIAEDEAVARAAGAHVIDTGTRKAPSIDVVGGRDRKSELTAGEDFTWGETGEVAAHPARVLAECEAKRRIVEEHRPDAGQTYCGCCWLDDIRSWEPFPCPTMSALAAVYSDHPAYREEWRP